MNQYRMRTILVRIEAAQMSDADIRIETSPARPAGRTPCAPTPASRTSSPSCPLRETVLFPQAVIPLAVARPSSVRAVDEAVLGHRLIGVLTQHDATQEAPAPHELHRMGTIATIHRMLKQSDGTIRLVVQGLERFRVVEFTQTTPHLRARIERVPDIMPAADDVEAQALEPAGPDALRAHRRAVPDAVRRSAAARLRRRATRAG